MQGGRYAKPANHLVSGFHSRGYLPHLKREGVAYFVTFRLEGTLPAEVLGKFKQERQAILDQALAANRPLTWDQEEELFRWYAARVDKYLDAGRGDCWLQRPEIGVVVSDALKHFSNVRYDLPAWVVMPNHVHAVVRPFKDWSLSQVLNSWKGYSGHCANKVLIRRGCPFWEHESYDHMTRDDDDRVRCCRYTIMNPVNAGLCRFPEEWKWSSAYRPS
jgi:REP element-mobilizing transposase RayT